MSTQENQCHSFQTPLQFHMKHADFRSGSQLADQMRKSTLYDGKIVGSVKVIRDDSVICRGSG